MIYYETRHRNGSAKEHERIAPGTLKIEQRKRDDKRCGDEIRFKDLIEFLQRRIGF